MAGQSEATCTDSELRSIDSICCTLNGDGHQSEDQAAIAKMMNQFIQRTCSPGNGAFFRGISLSNNGHAGNKMHKGLLCSGDSDNAHGSITSKNFDGSSLRRRQIFKSSGEQLEVDEDDDEIFNPDCQVSPNSSTENNESHNDDSHNYTAKTKSDIEGPVNDPKLIQQPRKVSFCKQISVQNDRGFCKMVPEEALHKTNTNTGYEPEVFSCEGTETNDLLGGRICSENVQEKRQKFSDKTSGYGTGDSDKNSENSSLDQQKDNEDILDRLSVAVPSYETSESSGQYACTIQDSHTEGPNIPLLSILDNTCIYSKNNVEYNSQGSDAVENRSESIISHQPSGRPNLSILDGTDQENDSVVLSRSLSSPSESFWESLPPMMLARLSSPSDPDRQSRNSTSDNQALRVLDEYQRSNSSPASSPQSHDSGALSHNSHRPLCKSYTFPMEAKDAVNCIEKELAIEELLNVTDQLKSTQSASVIEAAVKDVFPTESNSSSPITPLTPLTTKVLQSPSESGDLVDSQQPFHDDREKFPFTSGQTLELCPKGKMVQANILRASRCTYLGCRDPGCIQGKRLLDDLDRSLLVNPSPVTRAGHALSLLSLFDHSWNCYEMRCSVPWCAALRKYGDTLDAYAEAKLSEMALALSLSAQSPTLEFSTLPQSPSPTCKLSSELPYSSVTEGVHWLPLVRLGRFGTCVLAMDIKTQQHWVLKKEYLSQRDDGRLAVYSSLRDHTCPHIVTWMWMKHVECEKLLYVCSLAEIGNNLHQLVQSEGHLSDPVALTYFAQILQAAVFLHKHKILYLYWSAENVVFDAIGMAKLCNFSAAVCLTRNVDMEMVSSVVPPTLLPPELLDAENELTAELGPTSDSWGLGCLLKEILTGVSAWQDIIHEDRSSIIQQLIENPVPTMCYNNGVVQNILLDCWMISPSERKTAEEILQFYVPV